jgi:ferredoxin
VRIKADRDVCVGAGMCVLTAPLVFDQDTEEGLVLVLDVDLSGELADAARQAVDLCPSGALSVEEDDESES